MTRDARWRAWGLHIAVILALFAVQFVLPAYHYVNLARIMIYAVFAIGYNLLLGYAGLMSLGHAMFFAAGAYGAGLTVHWLGFGPLAALAAGVSSGLAASLAIAIVVLRTNGVAFLIVTLMMAQAAFLASLYFNGITLGDQGIVLAMRPSLIFGQSVALAEPAVKYNAALAAFAAALLFSLWIVRSPIGRVLIAMRENEPRTTMLGYNTAAYRFLALTISGTMSGIAGALYCLLFSYVGSSYASLQYSTFPLLWSLLGGAGTTLGPLVGTAIMFYLIDVASGLTSSYMLAVGVALIVLTLWFPGGIVGTVRQRWLNWLP
jgi:branched-chain amino acid transport system permease protein